MAESYFKILSKSSLFFLDESDRQKQNKKLQDYYLISSMIHSWLLFETYINHVCDILTNAKLDKYEKTILLGKKLYVDKDGAIQESYTHIPSLTLVLFILNNFSSHNTKKLRKTNLWENITWAAQLRNELVHPRQLSLNKIKKNNAIKTRESVIEIIKLINRAVFKKPLNLI